MNDERRLPIEEITVDDDDGYWRFVVHNADGTSKEYAAASQEDVYKKANAFLDALTFAIEFKVH